MPPETDSLTFGQQPAGFGPNGLNRPAPPLPPPLPPKRNPVLTRDDMARVIRLGGAVAHKGQVIAHEHLLPSDEELAAGDREQEARVAATLEAQIAYSQARLSQLNAAKSADPGAGRAAPDDADAKARAEKDEAGRAAKGGK